MTVSVGVVGAAGRMGRAIFAVRDEFEDLDLNYAVIRPDEHTPGDVMVVLDPALAAEACEVLIDFSTPDACAAAATACARHHAALITGTTGLDDKHEAALARAAERIPVVRASNFSVGVNLLEGLVELASRASGEDFDIEVFEAHHRNKVDAPSGTALTLAEAAARGRGWSLDEAAAGPRWGETGPRGQGEIGFQVVRGGSIVGEHTVFFCGADERIELTHRASDRRIFARGAMRAAKWACNAEPGLYSMKDVLF